MFENTILIHNYTKVICIMYVYNISRLIMHFSIVYI